MNKKTILFIILTGFVQASIAQIQFKDSTSVYKYWAKRGVIEATYSYMQDYVVTVGEADAKSEIVGKNKYLKTFIQDIDSKEELPSFSQISKLLNENSWRGAEKKLFNPLKTNFENKAPLNTSFFSCTKPGSDELVTSIPRHNNINEHWNAKIKEILSKYNESLLTLKKGEEKVGERNPKPNNVENKKTQSEIGQPEVKLNINPKQIPWKTFLLYGSIFIIGILIGGILIFIITKNKIKSIVNEEDKTKYNNYLHAANNSPYLFGYLRVVYFLHKQKDKYKKDIESVNQNNGSRVGELERKIAQLVKEKKNLLDKNIELGKKLEQESIQKGENQTESHSVNSHNFNYQASKKISKIYFSMPESDGSFQLSDGESSNDGKKYFKIEFEESSTKGELFYLSGDRDQRAINQIEDFLKPVCEIENITNSSTATRIILIQSGKVTLINDSWVIDPENKIKIKLY
ncbi:MAG: hypothetical protein ACOCQ4_00600 [bacterium]